MKKYVWISLSISSQSISMIFGKVAANNIGSLNIMEILFNVFYILSIACLVAQAFFWQKTLKDLELSVAYPMTSITCVLILVSGYLLFDEPIYLTHVLGVIFMITGTIIISKP
jgi:multidrug transporter EmrE-like cation transporter